MLEPRFVKSITHYNMSLNASNFTKLLPARREHGKRTGNVEQISPGHAWRPVGKRLNVSTGHTAKDWTGFAVT